MKSSTTAVHRAPAPRRGSANSRARAAGEVIDRRDVHAVFQPLVDLERDEVLGYEALARGPVGSPVESPLELFAAARALDRTAELDFVCRAAAYRAALAANLHPSLTLFVNNEPLALGRPCPADLAPVATQAEARLRIVSEMTERALATDPAALLAATRRARAVGWGVALDDVGAEPASLAFLPFVRPDVVKLDLSLIQDRTTGEAARIVNAVLAETEITGAAILAEGIETAEHLAVARSMGATIGQGWLWGRAAPLPPTTSPPRRPVRLLPPAAYQQTVSPYTVIAGQRPVRRTTKQLLMPMSRYLEHKGLDQTEPAVLLACFQRVQYFSPATRERFSNLARRATFVAALGTGMPDHPAPQVRGANLGDNDPLRGEWDVIVVGPHFAGALVARDLGDTGPDSHRRFDYVITHDRALIIEAAAGLLTKITPLP